MNNTDKYCPKCDKEHDWNLDCDAVKYVGKDRPYLEKPFDSSNKNLGVTKKGYAVSNFYAKEIWNEAIEAAARHVHDTVDAEQIRRLKK